MITIQAVTISGSPIAGARWQPHIQPPLHEGQRVRVSQPTRDRHIAAHLERSASRSVRLDAHADGGKKVVMSCTVQQVEHVLDAGTMSMETLIVIRPDDRSSEQAMLYLFDRARCDASYLKAVVREIE